MRGEERREREGGDELTDVPHTFQMQHLIVLCVVLVIWRGVCEEDMGSATLVDET